MCDQPCHPLIQSVVGPGSQAKSRTDESILALFFLAKLHETKQEGLEQSLLTVIIHYCSSNSNEKPIEVISQTIGYQKLEAFRIRLLAFI